MKILSAFFSICFLACTVAARAAEPANADREQQQVAALAREVQEQQVAIVENQTKINAKVTAIAEALRMAKIYASRAGK